ncbi:MAG: caspase family protein, partial [Bacteroidota bacterium]
MKSAIASFFFLTIFSALFSQKPELIIPIGHTDHVYTIAISPDGKWMVTGGKDNYLIIWNREGEILRKIPGLSGFIQSVVISPDGEKILACAGENAILWNKEGKQLVRFQDPEAKLQNLRTVAFSPTGDTVLLGREDVYNVALYKQDGTFLERVETKKPDPPIMSAMLEMSGVFAATFSPNGRYVLIGNRSYPGMVSLVEGKMKQIQAGGPNVHLWDLTTHTTQKISGHRGEVLTVAFSPDGNYFATAGKDSLCIIRKLNGQIMGRKNAGGWVNSLAFSLDGKTLAVGGKGVQLWSRENGEIRELSAPTMGAYIYEVGFSPNGQQVFASCNRDRIHFWDLEGNFLTTIESVGFPNTVGRFTADGKGIYSASSALHEWDFEANLVRTIDRKKTPVYHTAISGNEAYMVNSRNDSLSFLDKKGKLLWTHSPDTSGITDLALAHDGNRVLLTTKDALAELRDIEGKLICRVKLEDENAKNTFRKNRIYSGALSPDGKQFLITAWIDHVAYLYNDQGKRLRTYKVEGDFNVMESVDFSPDGSMMVLGERKGRVTLLRNNGTKIRSFTFDPKWLIEVKFSRDNSLLVASNHYGKVYLFDLKGNELLQFQAHQARILDIDLSPDNRFILTASDDQTTKIWDREGKEVLTLITMEGGEWVATNPEGRFDGTDVGMAKMHFVQGFETISFDQLKERFYEPGLVGKLLGYHAEPLRNISAMENDLAMHPEVSLSVEGSMLKVSLTPASGGIGRVGFFVGDSELTENINPEGKTEFQVDLSLYEDRFPANQAISIGVEAWNADESLVSKRKSLYFTKQSGAKNEGQTIMPSRLRPTRTGSTNQTRLFALCIGTGDYQGEKLDLSFAEEDAKQLAKALKLIGEKYYVSGPPKVKILSTAEGQSRPTKQEIMKELEAVAAVAKPEDVFLLYLSGHGTSYDDSWYYLTCDVTSGNIQEKGIRNGLTISSNELKEKLNDIKALKKIMILDACKSGQLSHDFAEVNEKNIGVADSRSHDRLRHGTGVHIITSSSQ